MIICSGCGGNAIGLASVFPLVVVNDIDPVKLQMLRNNGSVYNVSSKFEYVAADAYLVLKGMLSYRDIGDSVSTQVLRNIARFDVALLAPPWGGLEYSAEEYFDLHTMMPCGDFYDLVDLTKDVADNIICILPRNTAKKQIEEISLDLLDSAKYPCVVEDVYLWKKFKMTIVYFGLLFADPPKRRRKRRSNLITKSTQLDAYEISNEEISREKTHIRFSV